MRRTLAQPAAKRQFGNETQRTAVRKRKIRLNQPSVPDSLAELERLAADPASFGSVELAVRDFIRDYLLDKQPIVADYTNRGETAEDRAAIERLCTIFVETAKQPVG